MNRSTLPPKSASLFLRKRSQASYQRGAFFGILEDRRKGIHQPPTWNWCRSLGLSHAAMMSLTGLKNTISEERNTVVPRIMAVVAVKRGLHIEAT